MNSTSWRTKNRGNLTRDESVINGTVFPKANEKRLLEELIFYFPYKPVGGVPILFLRTSVLLSENFRVSIVDFSDGYMKMHLDDSRVSWIDFETVQSYPKNSILIFQLLPPWKIKDLLKFPPETRILFWGLHPDNLFPYLINNKKSGIIRKIIAVLLSPFSNVRKIRLQRFVEALDLKSSIMYMDMENYNSVKTFYNLNVRKELIPVYVPAYNKNQKQNQVPSQLRIVWLGRLVDFKVHILSHLIFRMQLLSINNSTISLDIVGSGDMEHIIRNVALQTNFQITFTGELAARDVPDYLGKNADLVVGMGQSAVEAASMGLPTILVDYSWKRIEGLYRFSWIFERENYSLGEEIADQHYETDSSFGRLITDFLLNREYVAEKCYNHWKNNHSADVFKEIILKKIGMCSYTINDLYEMSLVKPDIFTVIMRRLQSFTKNSNTKIVHGFRDL